MTQITHKMQVALNRYALGGVEMLRTETYSVSSNTIGALMKAGYMHKNGLTDKGKKQANPQGKLA